MLGAVNLLFTDPFKKDYGDLPAKIQHALDKALIFLIANPRRSSLRSKKLPGTEMRKSYYFTQSRCA
ncbi:hypothetical protein A2924_04710 [Candidatus Giovannonibacteria bacterium RIFCSPLOWO2_01_FULL_44_16]|uniref:Uncharacterized protein n=1 Tax=Candidatus Giovannonibacteria bacterium RIFCSPLOWO2_01_FULL_44_16 TaxID=1798348 RepID=A0A1F5X0B7_9BACT|nr:MAG: hypothetical protein A2924_04710 [Candidatus Giovannonibacteria bacterium RIFCSPLOWO2_01_FULL_44_16]